MEREHSAASSGLDGLSAAEALAMFQRCGKTLFAGKLNNSHSGNLSVLEGHHIWITTTGAMLHDLRDGEVVRVDSVPSEVDRGRVSKEFSAHAAIYEATDYQAVVHCHPVWATACAYLTDVVRPLNIDGYGALPGFVPVVEVSPASASPEMSHALQTELRRGAVAVLVRGHGLFAGGLSLEQAVHRAFVVETSARIRMLVRMCGANPDDFLEKEFLRAGYKAGQGEDR